MLSLYLIRDHAEQGQTLHLKHVHLLLMGLVVLMGLCVAGFVGYKLAYQHLDSGIVNENVVLAWQSELADQGQQIEQAQYLAEMHTRALTQRVAQIQAQVSRLDALGERLIEVTPVQADEFNFGNPPAMGGPEETEDVPLPTLSAHDFMSMLNDLEHQVADRSQQLNVMEALVRNQESASETYIRGRPITQGWLSSQYGSRTDPFSGRQAWHGGVDLAGQEDADIIAVAGGLVIFSGIRGGYGNLIEIDHGNGYITRYGHNKENLVTKGDIVMRDQLIAKMGSTGRSTGPHVHYEVLQEGSTLNPVDFIER